MRPLDLQIIGNELAIKWPDPSESFIPLETLRRACPCAGCRGETDLFGTTHIAPPHPLSPAAFQLLSCRPVGTYAIQPVWADGHGSGIFTWDWLRHIAAHPDRPAAT